MGQDTLHGLLNLFIEQDQAYNVHYEEVIEVILQQIKHSKIHF